MEKKEINLSIDEILHCPVIGEGSEGIVYQYVDNILIKIYRKRIYWMKDSLQLLDLPDKIYDKSSLQVKNYQDQFTFHKRDELDYIKLYERDTLAEIGKKRNDVKRTQLPIGPVFISHRFSGCFFQAVSGIPIHHLMFLPLFYKRKIGRSLIEDIQELVKNFVYPIDLNNSPFSETTILNEFGHYNIVRGHSHVYIKLGKQKTNLIDLDGKSTIYTDYFDETLYQYTLHSLCILLLEFLYGLVYMNEYYEDIDIFAYEIQKLGLSEVFASHVAHGQIQDFNEITRSLKL